MTKVEFFYNVEHKLNKVAELSQKAVGKQRKLHIFAPDANEAKKVEQYLWTHAPLHFIPNCQEDSALAAMTPVVIGWQGQHLVHDDVLINLQTAYPPFFSRFRRLIEIVGVDEADKIAARARFKFYRDRGYEIRAFDVNGVGLG